MRKLALLGLVWLAASCSRASEEQPRPTTPAPSSPTAATETTSVTLEVACSSEKKEWMQGAAQLYAASGPHLPNGRPIVVKLNVSGSGEAASDILAGKQKPHVYSPASTAYLSLLNEDWLRAHPKVLTSSSEALVLSPIVIAMWKPMAEVLGWPKKDLGWRDILAISKNPKGWGAYHHPEWGAFKLGHTHPEYSNSGLLAVLAEAYAAAGKRRGLTEQDLLASGTKKVMVAIEGSIVHYGKSTGLFAEKMLERGPGYMSAAVLYENAVIEARSRASSTPLVAIYPVEGTFWSDHPYAVLDAPWVGPDEKGAALQFLAFLKAKPQQAKAMALGFRPADSSIAIGAPIDVEHGVDPKQPQTLLEVPPGRVLSRLITTWREEKKTAEVAIVFDHSGSMEGLPLEGARKGALAFLDGLSDRDAVSLVFFSSRVGEVRAPQPLGKSREPLKEELQSIFADGSTALYDAISNTYRMMLERVRKTPAAIHAIVVMTDGRDEGSTLDLSTLQTAFNPETAPVKIFTIAYGGQADDGVLKQIASAGQGTSVRGNASTIVDVYRDLSAFF